MPARRLQCGGRWRHGAGEELSRCERVFGNGFTQPNAVLGRPPDAPGALSRRRPTAVLAVAATAVVVGLLF
eukprot:SM000084S23108  [mRNA]  locus=s84:144070:144413:- [translate_table: standard]